MTALDSLAKQLNRLASDVQTSLKRARVEGERRLLQRQHRAALEELGERAYELVKAGQLPEEPLAADISAVESKLMEIEAKVAFPMVGDAPAEPTPGPGWEAADRFFKHDS